jgi:V8-like Glu-specific endopeptidase
MENLIMYTDRSLLVIPLLLIGLSQFAHADIVGGDEVKERDPIRRSIAGLYQPEPDGRGGALCTASVIGDDIAVTAAHCVRSRGPKPVLLFGRDLQGPETVKRPITAMKVHPQWKKSRGQGMDEGDIALVKFQGGLPQGYQPVATADSDKILRRGKRAVLAGYGISDAHNRTGSGKLRKAAVTIADPRPGKTEMILDQSHGKGACHGDSGGPAYVRSGRKTILAGVTNRSYPAGAPDDCAHQVVYTKIGAYRSWIDKGERALRASRRSPEVYSTHEPSHRRPALRKTRAQMVRRPRTIRPRHMR